MPARPWADKLRLDFLKDNLPGYKSAQERKKTRKFLVGLHDNYFARFPQPDEQLLSLEKKRVSAWMNNHSGGRGQKTNGGLLRTTRVTFRDLLRGRVEQKRRQKLQATQAYSEMYYLSKWKAVVEEEWQEKLKNEPDLPKSEAFAYRNLRVKQLYEDESDEVKAEVEHYRNVAHVEESDKTLMLLPDEDELDETEQSRRIAARETQFAIDNVEAVMSEMAKEIEDITGLKSHFLLAGPEPKRGGRMVLFTIAAGTTVTGNRSFKNFHPAYETEVHDKFFSFAKGCYTREVREKYANIPFGHSSNSSAVSSTSPGHPIHAPVHNTARKPTARKPTARKRARKEDDDALDAPINSDSTGDSDSDSDSDSDIEDPEASPLDAAMYTVSDDDGTDDMDIFSPLLPPARRIIDTKEGANGLKLYKTAEGEWLAEAQLERLANMARNARLLKEIGIEEAKQNLTTRPGGREDDDSEEPEDDQEFSSARTRTILPPRESHPRQSKRSLTYVEVKDDCRDKQGAISVPALAGGGDAIREPVSGDKPHPVASNPRVESEDTLPASVSSSSVLAPPAASCPPLSDETSVESVDHADLEPPMEVNDHASLDPASSSIDPTHHDASEPKSSLRSVDLNSVDFSEIPAWLCLPLKHFLKHFRGELEDKLLGAFVALEMAWQPYEKRIGTDGRPQAVAWWIKNARPIDRVPPLVDLAFFPNQVRNWWLTLQPQWRTPIIEDWPLPQHIPAGECWEEARLGGSNGLFLLFLCLYWWRRSAEDVHDNVSLAEYQSVAEDVIFVLHAILQSGVSQVTHSPLTGSARANARTSAKRKATLQAPEGPAVRARTLRSSGEKENIQPLRARRSRS